jgi:hypothetical protein
MNENTNCLELETFIGRPSGERREFKVEAYTLPEPSRVEENGTSAPNEKEDQMKEQKVLQCAKREM